MSNDTLEHLSDETLYSRWSAGDQTSGRVLIARRFEGVCKLIRSLLAGPEVEDAIQQVFERLATRARRGEPVENVRAFVAGMARNVVRERLRSMARQPVDLAEQSLEDILPSQSARLVMLEEHRLLLKGLHRLPIDDQILLELRYWERMRTRELAQALGVKHNTLRSRLRRAQARLEALLAELAASDKGYDSTFGSIDGWARDIRGRLIPHSRDCA